MGGRMVATAGLLVAGACGRVGFDPLDGSTAANHSLRFGNGAMSYVTLGNPAALHLDVFTIELWIRREGDGTNTGTSNPPAGISPIVPLFTRGRGETDTLEAYDINFFVGLDPVIGFALAADFEEGAAGAGPTDNHPIRGTTPIATGAWHHVAASYDGMEWRLYVDGTLDRMLALGSTPPATNSEVAAVIASSSDSTGVIEGGFDGFIDELRVWRRARAQAEIVATISLAIESDPDLLGRWGFDEGTGSIVVDSTPNAVEGQIGPDPGSAMWAPGAPIQ